MDEEKSTGSFVIQFALQLKLLPETQKLQEEVLAEKERGENE